mgnify:CR=1 FL=1
MSESMFDIEDAAGAWLQITKVSGQATGFERWQIEESGVPWLTRAQLHQLHGALSEMLGLGSSAPTSPVTASRSGTRLPGARARTHRPVHGGYPLLEAVPVTLVEQPDGSGGAARRV